MILDEAVGLVLQAQGNLALDTVDAGVASAAAAAASKPQLPFFVGLNDGWQDSRQMILAPYQGQRGKGEGL